MRRMLPEVPLPDRTQDSPAFELRGVPLLILNCYVNFIYVKFVFVFWFYFVLVYFCLFV